MVARILVVDDMKGVQYAILSVLKRAGHDVTEADNGAEAIQALETNEFDLVITDMLMPEVGGSEVISRVQQQDPSPAILAISGGGVDQTPDQALLGLEVKTLQKPFTRDQILSDVGQLLDDKHKKTA